MPAFSPRTNSIACGITSASFIASWPAPLGMRCTGSPAAATARSQRSCHSGADGAAAARIVSSRKNDRPRRSQIAAAAASTSSTQASRTGSVVARMSSVNLQRPGTTLVDPFGTSSIPIVPTRFGASPARFSR